MHDNADSRTGTYRPGKGGQHEPGWYCLQPPTGPPIGPVLRGADGEAYRRLWWLLLLVIILVVALGITLGPIIAPA